jgi:hypothetical protein
VPRPGKTAPGFLGACFLDGPSRRARRFPRLEAFFDLRASVGVSSRNEPGLSAAIRSMPSLRSFAKPYNSQVESGCTVDDLNALADTGKRFGVVYADPPWNFKTYTRRASRGQRNATTTRRDLRPSRRFRSSD